jgi:hypothetical protein
MGRHEKPVFGRRGEGEERVILRGRFRGHGVHGSAGEMSFFKGLG